MSMTIGEFARATGLTPRALRIYDEREILVPSHIDPFSGRRRYDSGQVRTGYTIKTLRDAGVPLAELVDLDHFDLAEYRRRLTEKRFEEDEALTVAQALEDFDASAFPVQDQLKEPQPWIGAGLILMVNDFEDMAEQEPDPNSVFDGFASIMHRELTAVGRSVTGPWWIAMNTPQDTKMPSAGPGSTTPSSRCSSSFPSTPTSTLR
ncbi:MerR family transcriptional regulator [Enemella sp. A6]|uniref:MerR family transcriptional regulator n=1 Tax=Enemella sp. A6 TaxID=3440152 RepID=UPI003EBE8F65